MILLFKMTGFSYSLLKRCPHYVQGQVAPRNNNAPVMCFSVKCHKQQWLYLFNKKAFAANASTRANAVGAVPQATFCWLASITSDKRTSSWGQTSMV